MNFRGRPTTTRICEVCGKPFLALVYRVNKGLARYCSHACWGTARANYCIERFWNHVSKSTNPDGCWIWTGSKGTSGYGRVTMNAKRIPAHRFSWELHYGPIPPGLQVLHHCDVRNCVRPDHLFLGTNDDNVADMVAKNRQQRRLNPDQVREIRRLYALGDISQEAIGKRFGITPAHISAIINRRVWRHIPSHHNAQGRGRKGPLVPAAGENNGHCKLTDEQVDEILHRYIVGGEPPSVLAQEYDVSPGHITNLGRGKSRSSHFQSKYAGTEISARILRGEAHSRCKLTDAQVAEIRRRYELGEHRLLMLAREYGVSDSHIYRIVNYTRRVS